MYIQKAAFTPLPFIRRNQCQVIAFNDDLCCASSIGPDPLYPQLIFPPHPMNFKQGSFMQAHLKARAVGKESLRALGVVEGAVAHAAPRCSDGQVPTVVLIP